MTTATEHKYALTLLYYLNAGREADFLKYEEAVLPILEKYDGRLLYRIRPPRESFVHPPGEEQPYEVHVVTFGSKEDFIKYKNDPDRQKHIELGSRAVKKIRMIAATADEL